VLLSRRDTGRRFFLGVWRKYRAGEVLEPLEQMVLAVELKHPEYHGLLEAGEGVLERDWTIDEGQTNPFLHLGLHLALAEQLGSRRPAGIVAIHRTLCRRLGDEHEAEHRMMGCLAELLWQAQAAGRMPDEAEYLEALKRLQEC